MKALFSSRYVQALLALAFSFMIAGIAWADDESTATRIARAESAAPSANSGRSGWTG
jgi:hypothetical protein